MVLQLPPARPTISNPFVFILKFLSKIFFRYFSVDQNLIIAEKLGHVELEVRAQMVEAVNFLKHLVENENEGLFGNGEVDVPTKHCFFPRLDIVEKVVC